MDIKGLAFKYQAKTNTERNSSCPLIHNGDNEKIMKGRIVEFITADEIRNSSHSIVETTCTCKSKTVVTT